MGDTAKGAQNFIKVAMAAATQPANLLVLGIGIGVSLLLPSVALPMIVLSFVAIVGISWSDINNESFIKSVLSRQDKTDNTQPVGTAYSNITYLLKTKSLLPEVKEDLLRTQEILGRIRDLLQNIKPEDQGYLTFSEEYIGKLTRRLIRLSELEQYAREFLAEGHGARLDKEIESVTNEIKKSDDPVTKKEYQKTLAMLKEQQDTQLNFLKKLQRIESYILRINTTFENTYAQMNKILLKEDVSFVDEGEILNDSLKKMVTDIDEFEKQTIDIAKSLDAQPVKPTKSKEKVTQ